MNQVFVQLAMSPEMLLVHVVLARSTSAAMVERLRLD